MGPMQAIMTSVMTIFFYAMVIAAVWKLFQVAADMGEIKTILSDIRRNTGAKTGQAVVPAAAPAYSASQAPILAAPMSLESAEALLREIDSEPHAVSANSPETTA